MKLRPAAVDAYVTRGPGSDRAVLIYGPDEGLVRARTKKLCAAIQGGHADALQLIDLTEADLKRDPARLTDELTSLSLIGGPRVVRVSGSGTVVSNAVRGVLTDLEAGALAPEAFLIAEAGELPGSNALRKAFESAKTAAVIACQTAEGAARDELIDGLCQAFSLTLAAEAKLLLTERLPSDYGLMRTEIEKLALYAGDDPADETAILACLPADGEGDPFAIPAAVSQGDLEQVQSLLDAAWSEGTAPVMILRTTGTLFHNLFLMAATDAAGGNPEMALKQMRPPPFGRSRTALLSARRKWRPARVNWALSVIRDAELKAKSTGLPDQAVCAQALLQIARAAKQE